VVQSVDRALALLVLFGEPGERLGVTEMAPELRIHKSTASRLAATLVGRGFLDQDAETERFTLGTALSRMGLLVASNRDLIGASAVALNKLAADTGQTANVSVLDEGSALCIAQREGSYKLAARSFIGVRYDLHTTALGKVSAAFSEPRPALADRLPAYTARTITDPGEFIAELDRVRRRGYGTSTGELEAGLNVVAVPVLDSWGGCCGAVDISGPASRMPPRRYKELAVHCMAAANDIAARLGAVRLS
jgi:DNA-binding IclR family transcriptional regulator